MKQHMTPSQIQNKHVRGVLRTLLFLDIYTQTTQKKKKLHSRPKLNHQPHANCSKNGSESQKLHLQECAVSPIEDPWVIA